MSSTHLLGPQRFLTTAGAVVRSLDIEGPVATITAGWEERESDDGELDTVLDGRSQNLRLFGRMMDVLEHDEAVAANITPASLTVAGVRAANKVYDASTAATLVGTANVTAVGGESVSVSGGGTAA